MDIRVQSEAFDTGAELNSFSASRRNAGAVVSFTGIVRDNSAGDLQAMEIEHYPGMTEAAIAKMADEATRRWSLLDCLVIHRHGSLQVGETIMMVATAAPHRGDAFAAAEFLMDFLKSRAPFWKREIGKDGAHWVSARDDDETALERWAKK